MSAYEPPVELRLTVGSYNIHGGVGHDRSRDLQRIAQVVSSLGVDIVALQEVGGADAPRSAGPTSADDAAARLAELTGLSAIRGPTMQRAGGDYGNVILTRFVP